MNVSVQVTLAVLKKQDWISVFLITIDNKAVCLRCTCAPVHDPVDRGTYLHGPFSARLYHPYRVPDRQVMEWISSPQPPEVESPKTDLLENVST
jgi:hypothetical protein